MGVRVKPDIAKGSRSGHSLTDQFIVRVFQVQDLDQVFNANILTPQALFAVDSVDTSIRVPLLLDVHPDPNLYNFVVVDRQTEADPAHNAINVFIQYRYRLFAGGYVKATGGVLRSVPFPLKNPNGSTATVTYTPAANGTSSSFSVSGALIYDKLLINGTFTLKVMERIDPEYFNLNYAGSVNWQPWRGYDARTLMLLPVNGNTEDNFWYHNQYTFHYREETHDQYAFYKDRYGVTPPEAAQSVTDDGTEVGNGWQRLVPKYQIDFSILFPWIPNVPPSNYGLPASAVFHLWGDDPTQTGG